jgi:hypothetical protein
MYGVIRQIYEGMSPFVYCMCETEQRAIGVMETAKKNEVVKNSRFFVAPIKDNSCIGDDYYESKL